jgi:uncharacterized protein DUF6448
MKHKRFIGALGVAALGLLFVGAEYAYAHCDGLDGPVVKAAQKALATNNVNLVLIWVQKENESELKAVFQQTLAVRKLSPESKALADRNLFETLVRLHRAGEDAPYTGLKPAGRDLGPAIPAADRAIESGGTAALEALLIKNMRAGLRDAYGRVRARKNYDVNDVAAGREYVRAYVEYIHFVERLHEATTTPAAGHFAEPESR